MSLFEAREISSERAELELASEVEPKVISLELGALVEVVAGAA
jgi:hypothetical protein